MIMKYDYPDVKNIVVCGDIHGAFVEMVFKLCVWYERYLAYRCWRLWVWI
jgi:hypothetical protein